MASDLVGWLLAVHALVAEPLAWLVVGSFLAGTLLQYRSEGAARRMLAGAWGLFAVFWLIQIPHFAFEQRSIIEGIGSLVAVPASAYVGYLLLGGRDSLFTLSRAVAVMGAVFMPFQVVVPLQEALVEMVALQVKFLMESLGFTPTLVSWEEAAVRTAEALEKSDAWAARYADRYHAYRNTFYFEDGGHPITYTILLACTGLGSMAIFAGLIAAVDAPLRRKARAFAVSIPVIYGLNLVRNVFIGLFFGKQWAQVFPDLVMSLFGTSDPRMVSYYVADRIVAQSLSVVALVAITYLVVRELPEVLVVVEDVLYVATGSEYDLAETLSVPTTDPETDAPVVAEEPGD